VARNHRVLQRDFNIIRILYRKSKFLSARFVISHFLIRSARFVTTYNRNRCTGRSGGQRVGRPAKYAPPPGPYPNLPTLKELGYPDLVASTWFSISAPAKLPPDIAERINQAIVAGLSTPEVHDRLERDGLLTQSMSMPEFHRFIAFESRPLEAGDRARRIGEREAGLTAGIA